MLPATRQAFGQRTPRDELHTALGRLDAAVPGSADALSGPQTESLAAAAIEVERLAAAVGEFGDARLPLQIVAAVRRLIDTQARVDRHLESMFALRAQFAALPEGVARRRQIRQFLRGTSTLIDLSGRLRYLSYDALTDADLRLAQRPRLHGAFVEAVVQGRSSIGAAVLAESLLIPPDENTPPAALARGADTAKLLELISATGQNDLLPELTDLVAHRQTPPAVLIAASQTIRNIGLPQDPRPRQSKGLPLPWITAEVLHKRLTAIDPSRLDGNWISRRAELLSWLDTRRKQGVTGDEYRLGHFNVRAGDWLLMRNPSPYNLFTELSPGLFTHVGVVTVEEGSDGRRRFVVVDLPERGTRMPATNVDTFVLRTRHYLVLRHPDPAVARKMGEAAAAMIGNPTEFDLNFKTELVNELRGKPLKGQRIKTYCAGLLLLCAQQSAARREEFFPIPEFPAGGKTVENLGRIGITFGERFVSPTGALYSPRLQIVGRRAAMYDPRREVEEAIFDYFADRLVDRRLVPSSNLQQSLRTKLAAAAKENRLLARALAAAAGVSEQMDLLSAAKAAAVVETLDEVAYGNSGAFLEAADALRAGPIDALVKDGIEKEEIKRIQKYRRRHTQLFAAWTGRKITDRQLRIALVSYYTARGRRDIDSRFFGKLDAEE